MNKETLLNSRSGLLRRISIITPCYNAERYIAETVASVVEQTAVVRGRIELEYIICDGASRDATIQRARTAGGTDLTVLSEPDTGMYDALAKGLRRATGDIVGYINAGDYYHPHAFDAAIDLFDRPDVQWLTGYAVTYNEVGQVTQVTLPFRYRRDLLTAGAYNGVVLPFVQQESTFWRRSLLDVVDMDRLASCRLAGDGYLWRCFASVCELHIAEAYLGGFRRHRGQLSEDSHGYKQELESFAEPLSAGSRLLAYTDAALWHAPPRVKKCMNSDLLLRFDHRSQAWR